MKKMFIYCLFSILYTHISDYCFQKSLLVKYLGKSQSNEYQLGTRTSLVSPFSTLDSMITTRVACKP